MKDFYYCQTVAHLLKCGFFSDEGTNYILQLLLVLVSAVILGSQDHISLFLIRDFPNLDGQNPIFKSLRKGAASYDSQAYSGVIRAPHQLGESLLKRSLN
jgi:hypothetical protein